ncbi:glycosyltransferase [Fibrobacterota bacterium]
MKIAYLNTSLNPGGVATLMKNLLPELVKHGVHSELILTRQRGLLAEVIEKEGYKVHQCLQHWRYKFPLSDKLGKKIRESAKWSFWIRLAKVIRKIKPDIVHSNAHGMLCTSQLLGARMAGVPFVLRIGSPSSTYQSTWRGKDLFCRLLRPCDRIFGVSKSIYDAYPDFLGKAGNNVVASDEGIPNGIADPGLRNQDHNLNIRSELGIPREDIVLGSIGRFVPEKQYQDLIAAAANIIKSGSPVHLILVGSGSYLYALKNITRELDLSARVHFVGAQTNPSHWLNVMDMFVYSSEFEAFPNSILEAMAQGIPVIASNVYGNRDLIRHEENGLLYPGSDRAALTASIQRLIDAPELKERLWQRARRDYLEKYQVSICAQNYLNLYEAMLAQKNGNN